jgi:flagellar assembly protein FliH
LPIVKNAQARELLGSAVVLDLADVRREAVELVASARLEADAILAAAREEAARLAGDAAGTGRAEGLEAGLAEGREAGLEAGRTEGRAEAMASMSERLEAIASGWSESLEAFLASRDTLREEARRDLLRLSIAIAERVLGRLPAHDPGRVAEHAAAAIDMLAAATAIRLRVHPEDLEIVKVHFEDVLGIAGAGSDHDLIFETDEAIVRGGCVAAAADGEVDARLDVQMSRIVKGLFPELLESPSVDEDAGDREPPSATAEEGE